MNNLKRVALISMLVTAAPLLLGAIAQAQNTAFECKTEKHTVIIDEPSPSAYRYRSWNIPKKQDVKPDMEVRNGKEEASGSGPCGHRDWSFKTGNVEFLVSSPAVCTEKTPPKGATGSLNVLIDKELKNQFWCSPVDTVGLPKKFRGKWNGTMRNMADLTLTGDTLTFERGKKKSFSILHEYEHFVILQFSEPVECGRYVRLGPIRAKDPESIVSWAYEGQMEFAEYKTKEDALAPKKLSKILEVVEDGKSNSCGIGWYALSRG